MEFEGRRGKWWLYQPQREVGIELVMMRGVGRWNSKEEQGSFSATIVPRMLQEGAKRTTRDGCT
jgi:hypothetical protein